MEKTFSKYDLLYSIKSVYLQCSPGRSSPRYQMLVMNPGFFMPCILVTKIVDRVDFRVFFFRNFQVFNNSLDVSVYDGLFARKVEAVAVKAKPLSECTERGF